MRKNRQGLKHVAAFLAIVMLNEALFPLAAFALTSGPSAPEFSSFEPVSTNSMVNEFTGDFTYNIPLLNIPGDNGSGYPLSLSYHSGESPESEASWVGYGWTLNPGAINRSKRGFADDVKGSFTQYNDVPNNWTVAVGVRGNTEVFGKDLGVGVNATARYNSYKGFGYTTGAGITVGKGMLSLGFSFTDGQGSFSAQVNPAAIIDAIYSSNPKVREAKAKCKSDLDAARSDKDKNSRDIKMKNAKEAYEKAFKSKTVNSIASSAGSFICSNSMGLLGDNFKASSVSSYTGFAVNLSVALGPTVCVPVTFQGGLEGSFNIQFSDDLTGHSYYGYMYSSLAYDDENAMMDYLVEKNYPYCKRDFYLGIPFSGNDIFSVMGEGIGGSFRLRNRNAGYFRPNKVVSSMGIFDLGAEFQIGTCPGMGGDIGGGYQRLVQSDNFYYFLTPSNKDDTIRKYKFSENDDEGTYFRFENDLGGEVSYGYELNFVKPLLKDPRILNTSKAEMSTNENISKKYNPGTVSSTSYSRPGRSAYIGYTTKEEARQSISNGTRNISFRAYDKANVQSNIQNLTIKDESICEFSTVNQDGNTFTYGIPVMNSFETSMTYGIGKCSATLEQGAFAYVPQSESNYNMVVGEVNNDAYASTYLLTQITTPDYLDLTYDGCTSDDLGGYTLFKYNKVHNNYKWRYPYTGLKYNPAHLCESTDDIGTVSYGYKEVYYLESIETRTHIAVFITENRSDGLDANSNEATARESNSAAGNNVLKKLTRIELYAKDENGAPGKLLQTVHFDYDYTTWLDTPNSSSPEQGRLTLKKVWIEYNGVKNVKISPYQFQYTYPNVTYPEPYSSELHMPALSEDDHYSPTLMDRWGNYQKSDPTKLEYLFPWVDQTPDSDFDPAINQLKRIILPSGGEIHIQYEQDDYLYVQDRRAMAMVSLMSGVSDHDKQKKFILNVEDDLEITDPYEKDQLVAQINNRYVGKKIYFKFLYTITNQDHKEIIDGYAEFKNAYVQNDSVYVELDPSGSYSLPKDVARDFKRTERGHKFGNSNNLDINVNDENDKDGVTSAVYSLLDIASFDPDDGYDKWDYDFSKSFFRIPVLHKKLGGGVRVKRLLMYDPGIETGAESVYGNEYCYQDENGNSSGVATNEPAMGREENALVDIMDRRADQGFVQKVISGKDKDQFEGPIGESLLPGPSVGYSRVLVKSISSKKSSAGITELKFFTFKDYPFDYDMTSYAQLKGLVSAGESCKFADNTEIFKGKSTKLNLPLVYINLNINDELLSQGYRFILYNIHGRPKEVNTYAANNFSEISNSAKTSGQRYEYFKPGEKIPMFDGFGDIRNADPGREMEVVFEIKNIKDVTYEGNIEIDGSLGVCVLPIPFLTGWFSTSKIETSLGTLVATKIISYPVIQKSVTVTKDQISQTTINEAFDPYTGTPLVTRVVDGFDGIDYGSGTHDGSYMSWTVPAAHVYDNMGQKATGERTCIKGDGDIAYNYSNNYSASVIIPKSLLLHGQSFTAGDLIYITNTNPIPGRFVAYVNNINNSDPNNLELSLINAYKIPFPSSFGTVLSVEIIRSGKTNQLTVPAYEMTTYDDKELLAQTSESAFFNLAKVISAKATAYDDSNNYSIVNNSQYQKYLGEIDIPSGENCFSECLPKGESDFFASGYGSEGVPGDFLYGLNDFEYGKRGKFRPRSFYQYKSDIVTSNSGSLIQNSGYFSIPTGMFKFFASNDVNWLLLNTITKYNPDGNAVEEKNLLDIYSTALMGYRNTLPVLIAKNASYGSVAFEGFESVVSNSYTVNSETFALFENYDLGKGTLSTDYSHTGYTSFKLASAGNEGLYTKVAQHKGKEVKVSMWVKNDPAELTPVKLCTPNGTVIPKLICRSGEWALFEAVLNTGCVYVANNSDEDIYIDDLRLQPVDASAACYVYDKNYKRVAATFDDQHFATIYQYNGEGKLVRKLIETEKGIKLLQETQYNTPAINRN